MTQKYHVTVRYRTNSGCNTKMLDIKAESMDEAIRLASAKVKKQRGVIRVDGGDCYAHADNRYSISVGK